MFFIWNLLFTRGIKAMSFTGPPVFLLEDLAGFVNSRYWRYSCCFTWASTWSSVCLPSHYPIFYYSKYSEEASQKSLFGSAKTIRCHQQISPFPSGVIKTLQAISQYQPLEFLLSTSLQLKSTYSLLCCDSHHRTKKCLFAKILKFDEFFFNWKLQNTLQKKRKIFLKERPKTSTEKQLLLSGLIQALAPPYSQLILKPQQNFDLCPPIFTSSIIVWNLLSTFENSIWIITIRSNYFISFSPPLYYMWRGKKQTILTQKVKKQTTFSSNWSIIWTREITLSFIQVQIRLKLSFCFPSLLSAAA